MSSIRKEARATLILAVPIIIGQVSQMLMGVTDSVMIGRTGTVPLAASAFGNGIFNLLFIVGIGLLTPVSVFASRSKGEGRHGEAGEFMRHGVLIAVAVGAVEFAIVLLSSRHLALFDQPPEVLSAVNPFYILIGFSIFPVLAYFALRQFAESMGRPWMPMVVMLAGVGLNALGNWVLIYGHLGVPALGLTGAGISTLISRSLSTLFIFLLLRFDPMMREAWPQRWLAPFSRPRLRRMLEIGLPAAGGLLFETGAFAAATVMMGWLGAVPLAAHQIAITCAAMTFMCALGISMAVGIRMSSAVGSGDHATLRHIWQGGAWMGLAVSLSLACVFFFFGRPIAAFFVRDPEVVSVASSLLFVASLFQIFDSAQVINAAALRGLTDVKVPAAMTFVAYWVIALPLGYLFAIRGHLGPAGIWWGLAAALAAAAVMLGIRVVRMTQKDVVHRV